MPPNPQKLYNSLSKDVEATTPAVDTMIRRLVPAGRVPHVCIVGAGVAGLRCADLLSMRGVKVTLLEARNRIGGRVGASKSITEQWLIESRFTKVTNWVGLWICKLTLSSVSCF